MKIPTERRSSHPAWLLVLAYVVIAGLTVFDYGVSMDEDLQATYAEMVIDYYASGFQERAYEKFLNLVYYGPFFEVLPALVYRHIPEWKYEIRHVFIVLFAAAGLVAVLKIGHRLSDDRRVAVFAVLALLLMPAHYGHTFFNSKDIPFAVLFSWSVWAMLRLFERPQWKSLALLGVVAGIMLAIRVGGVLLFMVGGAAILLHALIQDRDRRKYVRIGGWLAGSAALAWLVMLLFWPWAQSQPIANPLEALRSTVNFGPVIEVRFAGHTWRASELPPRYLTQMLAITTPLPTLTLIGAGLAAMAPRLIRRQLPLPQLVLLVWVLVPPLLQAVLKSPVYDGTRHFLFIFPALACTAAIGAVAISDLFSRAIATAAVGAALLSVVPAMIQLHPYQYVYYNALVGGPGGAAEDYDTDYWGTSYREASLWVGRNRCHDHPTSVMFGTVRHTARATSHFVPKDITFTPVHDFNLPGRVPDNIDYYVGLRRMGMDTSFPETPVTHRIQRMGATLAVIRGSCRDVKGFPSQPN